MFLNEFLSAKADAIGSLFYSKNTVAFQLWQRLNALMLTAGNNGFLLGNVSSRFPAINCSLYLAGRLKSCTSKA